MRFRFLVVLVLLLAGCAPVVTHGPRVERGRSYGVVAGWRAGLCDSGCTAGLVPPIGAYLNHGIVPGDGAGPAYNVGVFVPAGILVPAAHLDLYVQAPAPPARPVAWGGGLSVSMLHVMPYLEAGDARPGGAGWYTTQGLVLAAYRPEPDVFLNGGRGTVFQDVVTVYWSPTLAYRFAGGSLFVSGAFGREETQEYDAERDRYRGTGHRPLWSLLAGASARTPRWGR